MSAKIFISYSTVDLAAATRAKKALEAVGHNAHVAEYDTRGGAVITDAIKRQIHDLPDFRGAA